jgi:TonB family protein
MTPYLPTEPRGRVNPRRVALIAVGCTLWLGLVGAFGAFQWSKFSQLRSQARRAPPPALEPAAPDWRSPAVASGPRPPPAGPAPAALEALARAGDARAALQLARAIERQQGPLTVAFEWRLRAAELGDPIAMAGVARAYRQGSGVARDAAQAQGWTERAVAAGDAELWSRIGRAFQHGIDLPRDPGEAAAWYRRAAGGTGALEIGLLDQTPRAVFQRRPQYPSELRRRGVGGEVVVDFLVDREGNVQNAYALRSTEAGFEVAAIEAVSAWRFEPGRKNGAPVITHMQVPIVFTLHEEPAAPRGRTAPPAPRP